MSHKIHFISGLPRSGSTLLGAILRQNPRFQAGMSSPVFNLCSGLIAMMSAGGEMNLMIQDSQKPNLVRNLFTSYYSDPIFPKNIEVIFDTNRGWCGKLHTALDLFPNAKVICTVRNLAWIMDSLERVFRKNPYENTRLFGPTPHTGSVYGRVNTLSQPNSLVGSAYLALREAFYSENSQALLVVDYELLTRRPHEVMPLIYEFIDEPWFEHDFDNVEYDAPDFDQAVGARGLHHVARKVEFKPRKSLLPPDLFQQYSDQAFWTDLRGSAAKVIAPEQKTKKNEMTDISPMLPKAGVF
ncbi:MAG: sulfotransferase [Magnetococcales bacterium]|nr:sulfotransferase [Magnetococcales bacterium]